MTTKKKKTVLTFPQKMMKLSQAGMANSKMINRLPNDYASIPELDVRVRHVLGLINNPQRPATNMLFFVMYDIENNKVRNQIAKYLLRKGCTRVQRSIFLADLNADKYESIRSDLAEVQSLYDNHDSILIVPISTDYLQAMKIIGKSIDVDIIMKSKNTLFF
ncbi:CRISPR-associated endonuclease Cas2 [Bacteroides sp. UBA939]|uniref:CRISPR-associated endonuclease Cas2 n=1 Tax=Bacteroides sp. UBA939 TaxID=1946092 RepID=UPI0025C6875C|nr:CRISPR-associated endonuclease Cas2 [Bacteroides sp. UBA939]